MMVLGDPPLSERVPPQRRAKRECKTVQRAMACDQVGAAWPPHWLAARGLRSL